MAYLTEDPITGTAATLTFLLLSSLDLLPGNLSPQGECFLPPPPDISPVVCDNVCYVYGF